LAAVAERRVVNLHAAHEASINDAAPEQSLRGL
jgi:hypothetical protein